jgi:hypothetical protein
MGDQMARNAQPRKTSRRRRKAARALRRLPGGRVRDREPALPFASRDATCLSTVLPLHRAIYVSDAVGDAANSLLVLAEILGASERNNRRDGLTGVLMRHGGRFLQAVEGRRADVDRLMDRLRADARHENVQLLSYQGASHRLFGGWPMALAEMTLGAERLLNGATLDQLGPERAETLLVAAAGALPVPA